MESTLSNQVTVTKRISLACLVAALVLLGAFLPLESWHGAFVDWSEHHPILAVLAFSCLVVLGMVFMLPVSIQAMTAGFLFGEQGICGHVPGWIDRFHCSLSGWQEPGPTMGRKMGDPATRICRH
jgi:uncharacterized membrane protein YdjX (TVP38/TMEM64 family)